VLNANKAKMQFSAHRSLCFSRPADVPVPQEVETASHDAAVKDIVSASTMCIQQSSFFFDEIKANYPRGRELRDWAMAAHAQHVEIYMHHCTSWHRERVRSVCGRYWQRCSYPRCGVLRAKRQRVAGGGKQAIVITKFLTHALVNAFA
jgi:hypothetical protein